MKSIKGPSRYESPLSSKVADGKEGRRACAESLSGLSVAFQATTNGILDFSSPSGKGRLMPDDNIAGLKKGLKFL